MILSTKEVAIIGPFKIIGTADGGNTFTTQEWTFNITCGSEVISPNMTSYSYVFPRSAVENSFTNVNNSQIATYFITDKPQCPASRYEVYLDAEHSKSVMRSDAYVKNGTLRSVATLQVQNTVPMEKTYYLKGISAGD